MLKVKVDGKIAGKVLSGNLGDDGVYESTNLSNSLNLKVYVPMNRNVNTRTVTYEYLLKNVGVKYNDTAKIFWNFIGNEWDTKIETLTINIKLPYEAIYEKIYVFGHGSDNGTFEKNGNYITLNAKKLSANQALDARILFSKGALNTSKTVNRSVLNDYIKEEEGLSNKKEELKVNGLKISEISYILIGVIILVWIIVYFKYDKEIKVEKQHYFRDIPCDLEPEILQRIYYGKKCKNSFWITFLNLVKLGVYKIEDSVNEVGKSVKKIIYNDKKDIKLKEHQKQLINIINGFFDKDANSINLDTLNAKMKRSTGSSYKNFLDKLEEQQESYFGDSSKKTPKAPFYIALILIICIILLITGLSMLQKTTMGPFMLMFLGITTFVYTLLFRAIPINLFIAIFLAIHFSGFEIAIVGMMVVSGISSLYIPYLLAFIFVQYTSRIKRMSKEERQIREQVKGLRRYIKDYSKISEKNIDSIVIWEDYLIIAIALGLNKKTINYFYDYCKENLNDEFGTSLDSFRSYHYMDMVCHSTLNSYVRSYNSAHYSSGGSSYSGSRGGFSGGHSSGGHGGGGGRRKLFLVKKN